MRHTIKEWMAIKGMSRCKVADLCQVSEQTVTNWQKRPKGMNVGSAMRLAHALEVNINDITDFDLSEN